MIKSAVTTLLLVGSVLAAIAFTRCDGAPALSFDAPRPHDSTLAEQLTRAGNAAWLRPVGMDGNVKPAVVVPTPSTIPFFVRPESTTVLQFEYGVSSAGSKAPADRFEFAVLAQRSDGTVSPVFRQTPGYDAPARWQLARVPLETFAGDEVVLHFQIRRARPKDGTDREAGYSIVEQTVIPAWANVRIRTKRSAETGALPNIVWITIDTVRADHLGCYGYDRPTSPAIDALADEGIRIAPRIRELPVDPAVRRFDAVFEVSAPRGCGMRRRIPHPRRRPYPARRLVRTRLPDGRVRQQPATSNRRRGYNAGFRRIPLPSWAKRTSPKITSASRNSTATGRSSRIFTSSARTFRTGTTTG